jgi:hypothetical protein
MLILDKVDYFEIRDCYSRNDEVVFTPLTYNGCCTNYSDTVEIKIINFDVEFWELYFYFNHVNANAFLTLTFDNFNFFGYGKEIS